MKRINYCAGILTICICMLYGATLRAQATSDSALADSSDVRTLWRPAANQSGLTLASGKRYNRVEGLPVLFGPVYRDSVANLSTRIAVLGIIRSAHEFHWDAGNLGHLMTAEFRFGERKRFGVDAASYDVVEKAEDWQMSEPEAGLAAFFLHRDYFDYFGRHGGSIGASLFMTPRSSLSADFHDERWSSRDTRDVFTIFRNGEQWRDNPEMDDGRVHVAELKFSADTRNDPVRPLAGWLVKAEYENASGRFTHFGATSADARSAPVNPVKYGRMFLDLRRYNRLSPDDQLNARLVLAGWLHGDELPLERRVSVGGVGTIAGFDFRRRQSDKDYAQCGGTFLLPGNPAQCERVMLVQLEYRSALRGKLARDFRIQYRGIGVSLDPTLVAFADAGRGWLVGPRKGNLQYPSGSIPEFDTFMTDVGIGFDVGFAAIYVAKAVSVPKEPAKVFLRIRKRF